MAAWDFFLRIGDWAHHPKTTHHFLQPLITIPIIFDNLTSTFEVLQNIKY